MWKQLTQRARKAIFLAQEEAGKLGYSHVGPEHLLLALMREDDCMAIRILEGLGLDPGTVRVEVMKNLSRGAELLGQEMQLTMDAKQAVDLAFQESKSCNEEWVGTEHLLIGLAGSDGLASTVLVDMGADSAKVRNRLRQLQGGTLPFEPASVSRA